MDRRYEEDNELKKLLEDQLIREAEIMKKELFADEDFEDYEMSREELEASYERLMERLSGEDAAEEDSEDGGAGASGRKIVSFSGEEKKREKKKASKRRFSPMRVAGIAVLCVACVFAASMTGEANRRYVIDSVKYLLGRDTRVVVDNDEDNELPETDEYEAIADIENTLGVDVPEFMYRPEGFDFRNYSTNIKAGRAWIEYDYEDTIIVLDIDQENEDASSAINSIHGEERENISILSENISATLKKVEDINDLVPTYMAHWERKDVSYQFSGKMNKEIFVKMIQKIIY